MIHRLLVILFTLGMGASARSQQLAQSEWVGIGPDGRLIYKTTPNGDRIMDFSSAGYMGGGVALPVVPVKITVGPSGGRDDTASIQNAINQVGAMPLEGGFRGAVLLAPGIFMCARTIYISTNGVVLRGSGSGRNASATTIKMTGERHAAIVVGTGRDRRGRGMPEVEDEEPSKGLAGTGFKAAETTVADTYVPSGATSFTVADASGFAVGDTISIRRPVTAAWIRFMRMDDLVRDGRRETWLRQETATVAEREITVIAANRITLSVPLSDSYDSRYLKPPGTAVVKVRLAADLAQVGVEHLHIQAPPKKLNFREAPYSALRISGEDCWAFDLRIEETMNSVSVRGRRITLREISLNRTVPNIGSAKPAEFAPNAGQILLDRCSGNGDNIFPVATGAGLSGPIVLLNCTFDGDGRIQGHQRWSTGMLLDNCRLPEGGIDFMNRGEMGSGHGWGMAWAVAWNCVARSFIIQQPPGAYNWMIGCTGRNIPTPRPFGRGPALPLGISDSPGQRVAPQSLYLAQLAERLGTQALKNIGYAAP